MKTGPHTSSFEDHEYICKTDHPVTYKIYGDVKSFVGPSFQSSQTILTFPSSITGGDKILDLNNDITQASVNFAQGDGEFLPNGNVEGTFKGLIIRVVDNTGDEPLESANELYGAFFEDSINFGVSVVSVSSYLYLSYYIVV